MRGPTNQANNSRWNLDLVANFTFQIKNTPQSINLASKHYRIWFQTFMACSGDARSPVYELPILKLHRCMTHELSEDCRSIELFTLIHVSVSPGESMRNKQDAKTSSVFNLSAMHMTKSSTDPSSWAWSICHWGDQHVNPTVLS